MRRPEEISFVARSGDQREKRNPARCSRQPGTAGDDQPESRSRSHSADLHSPVRVPVPSVIDLLIENASALGKER